MITESKTTKSKVAAGSGAIGIGARRCSIYRL